MSDRHRTPNVTRPPDDDATVELRYEDGTIRIDSFETGDTLEDVLEAVTADFQADHRSGGWRIPAVHYAAVREALADAEIDVDDHALSLESVPALQSAYELREYQQEALSAWLETDRWADAGGASGRPDSAPAGVLELPTGSGKTVVALEAIARLGVATLVVVPTIDLLEQWIRELETEFSGSESAVDSARNRAAASSDGVTIGRFGGGEQRLEPITVSTYDSAYLKSDAVGDRFGLVVFDEVHHLGGEGYREIARLLAAPARLGLTATFERPDDAHEIVEELVGPVVYRVDPEELAGDHLAPYDVKRLEVALTPDEREEYERKQEIFTTYLARSNVRMQSGSDYQELVKRSGNDPEAREALLARQRAREIMLGSEAKLETLEGILADHREERTIVFTAHNDLAYDVSERFLIPTITHQTGTAERREILERFREGTYSRIATSNVLDEGVDVPDASVAVVLSGSGSEREFTQRLGRILRPKSDGSRALLYEVISRETGEERVSQRRR
ncbi:DEAD/DEAH box helicase family protein [Natrarchaeobius chitinivorans]|uniref:DNA 3'-5' helicase n=1 Tax=Natrarchaeobius chitinivorans TaxID=1679083 RepID=A0A3N6M5V1_NATCH|nr:DEAD/DEAH box helicase family protein [Natrarchaeobius chitinivorans]RQG95934.1 DEAD/DEAH box helicase [Natrarchaeobius chitinivorans]